MTTIWTERELPNGYVPNFVVCPRKFECLNCNYQMLEHEMKDHECCFIEESK